MSATDLYLISIGIAGLLIGCVAGYWICSMQEWLRRPRVKIEDEADHPFIRRFNP